jgi:hypothetical protein
MQIIGRIVRLQIQARSLKVAAGRGERYDPGALVSVPELALDGRGAVGRSAWGEDLLDIHHPDHLASRFRHGNGISMGFTSHYAAMRERFGDHLTDGIAGENILTSTESSLRDADLQAGLLIETIEGSLAYLGQARVATPCVPFARYALRLAIGTVPDRAVTAALQFLNEGRRGFYLTLRDEPVIVAVGATVYRA